MLFNIYVETELGGVFKQISMVAFKYSNAKVKSWGGKAKTLAAIRKQYDTTEKLLEFLKKDESLFQDGEFRYKITHAEVVSSAIGKWVHGEYYAHEYGMDEGYCPGRGRRIRYSNGYVEYEVQCLDDGKSVLDGMWDADDVGTSRIGNGCGDHFTPFEKGMF